MEGACPGPGPGASASTPPAVRVGTAGWSYPDWEGRVYPRPRPRGFHPLAFLARYVDCVEVNSTFYALPQARHASRWAALLEPHPDFRLLAKIHRDFTHGAWTSSHEEQARAFLAGLAPLGEAGRMAALLAQFSIAFRFAPRAVDRLARIRDLFGQVPLVVEVRHRSWFEAEGLEALADLGLGLAHIDLPVARDHPPERHPSLGPLGYVRLHGRNAAQWFRRGAGRDERYDYLYRQEELDSIAARIREVASEARETYVVANNHYGGQAAANALELKALLGGGTVRAPATLVRAFPRLASSAEPEGQRSLFD